jgi:hypothetical protein
MWFLRRRVQVDRLPPDRVTVQFEFPDADKRRFWLVLHRPEVDLHAADPGFDPTCASPPTCARSRGCSWARSASPMRSATVR